MLDVPGLSDGLPQAGTLTFHDLFRVAPYADSIVLLRLPARALQAFLDDNARRADLPGEPREERGFVQFSREVRYRIARRDTGGEGRCGRPAQLSADWRRRSSEIGSS